MIFTHRARVNAIILGLVALFLCTVMFIATMITVTRRSSALENSEAQVTRFVSGAEAAINRSFLGVDVLLASTNKLLNLEGNQRDWIDVANASHQIQNAMRQNLLISRIALIDPQGLTIASSDPSDTTALWNLPQDFVKAVLSQTVSTLVMSAPTVSFRSSELVLYMGRHLKLADGSLLIAVAEVPVPQLTSVLVQGADIEGLQATIEKGNGELLIAAPLTGPLIGRHLQPALGSEVLWDHPRDMRARLTGAPAIVLVRNSLYAGVYITASIPIETALQGSRLESWYVFGVATVLSLMILGAGAAALLYLNRMTLAQRTIAQSKDMLDQALESMVSGFILLDRHFCVVNWNRRFVELHPWLGPMMKVGVHFDLLVRETANYVLTNASPAERDAWTQNRIRMLREIHDARQVTSPTGAKLEITERPTPDGGTVIVYQDVTRLHQAMADVEKLAFYDPLTGLPNRRLLNDRLQQGILSSLRTGRHGALLFLDLDHFKTLNDTAGHVIGDELLTQVAQRLTTCVRDEDTVARLGGDEFVVMLQSLSTQSLEAARQTQRVGQTILDTLNQPYVLNDTEYTSTCSMGATLFGGDHQDATELLKQADIAMYQVKSSGRNALCFFDPEMLQAITVRADMERDLRQALSTDQLTLYYQVQVRDHGHPVGAEVLIRWQHPQHGLISPAQFIPMAEETGLILPIGEWVIHTACAQLKAWESMPAAAKLQLAVNVSARQFKDPEFVERVSAIVAQSGIRPNLLKLELTESMVLDNISENIAKMQSLKALGVQFSMDDFGTGYSSLAYLTRLPLNQLKIDQSFVHNIGQKDSDAAVIDTIISLAKSLQLEVIAEGVETTEQRDFLEQHGCQMCQGYLFGKPMPLAEFETWLVPNQIAL